ncbi:Hypothetical protein GbCGDNIH2_5059 [Granulibacter bethesdensis]|uniref:Uncharacterized protein n=2 Tax=Granulibacter bethesdensis TaxID=364410 RepID=A0A286M359_GRABC|nr:Hypothetical protein GbCGDNIH3_5059 [Granulibacter bethesdensis]AHJ65768.1 Hypothetical protein GbCGDNIH4_5059 [Granulibacter bethesdensis CGDNIH4]ASV62458.1 Hypothetical protein GbCGDNIH1_5059 [Granulibacter bethesdensis CGDNIH1]AHJ68408.1 Hypothetical protein GbCGDNIH2_5059 [Granulibacter bethesdensis]APH52504.1 Hypothetical protein GbCGDNIH5_5059 [Granulibacter bethesdensis]
MAAIVMFLKEKAIFGTPDLRFVYPGGAMALREGKKEACPTGTETVPLGLNLPGFYPAVCPALS